MKSSARNIKMASLDDLLGCSDSSDESGKIQQIALSELHSFKNHPFQVLDDEAMQKMVESIEEYGVLTPAIARPRKEGGYELIAGHRRKHAAGLAGLKEMPVIVREMGDDEATIIMVDANLQRENLLPSEKAWAYRMKLEALNHQGVKGTSRQVGGKCSVDVLSENSSDSARNIHRFIRLTYLLPKLLQMADDKKLPFNPAVELSYLTDREQEMLLAKMKELSVVPSMEQAKSLKRLSQEAGLDEAAMENLLSAGKTAPARLTIKEGRLKEYFPTGYSIEQIEEVIFGLLEKWKNQNE